MRNPLEAVPIAVALVTNGDERGERLQAALQASGIDVYRYDVPSAELLSRIAATRAAAIIVDLDGAGDGWQGTIDRLVRQDVLPVLFNDGTDPASSRAIPDRELGERYRDKLSALLGRDRPAQEWVTAAAPAQGVIESDALPEPGACPAASAADAGAERDGAVAVYSRPQEAAEPARRVWVLGASLGGPDAVKRFIGRMPADLPAAFILAQHISAEWIALLMDQMRRIAALKILSARSGHLLQHGQLVVAPVDRCLNFNHEGRIHLTDQGTNEAAGSYLINGVMAAVAARFSDQAGAIVFSGIGNDGVLGARSILEEGGRLWAQAADSCIMSSMPDHVRNACPVALNASPEALADAFISHVAEPAACVSTATDL